MIRKLIGACGAMLLLACATAQGQTVNGYGALMTLPVVAQTSTFSTEIYVHNLSAAATLYSAVYIGGVGTASPGIRGCPNFTVAAAGTAQFSLQSICPGLDYAGSNFGRLVVSELETNSRPFALYARMQSFAGDGFSIEGFPVGEIDNTFGTSYVTGLKRTAAAPGYQTNCFVGAMNEPVAVTYTVTNGAGMVIGAPQNLSLTTNGFVRILDIFAAVGAPPGDYTNGRIAFIVPTGTASFLGFCTVQNNTTFDADFRIAKSSFNNDSSRGAAASVAFTAGTTTDLGGVNLIPTPRRVSGAGLEHNYAIYLRHPDWVTCSLSGVVPAGEGEIALLDPSGSVVAGSAGCLPAFPKTYLGEKSTRNQGRNGRWTVKVNSCGTNVPVTAYVLNCSGGNGVSSLTYGGSSPTSF